MIWLMISATIVAQDRPLISFIVSAGDHVRHDSPVSISLEGTGLPMSSTQYALFETLDEGVVGVPYQINQNRISWILDGTTLAGSVRNFELRSTSDERKEIGTPLLTSKDDGGVVIRQFERNIVRYQFDEVSAPEGESKLFNRGGFIHPLWSPKGEVLTRIQPPDHYHHYGIWNPWTSTTFEGRHLDFWNLNKGQGTVKTVNRPRVHSGPVFAEVKGIHEHIDLTAPDPSGYKAALDELWQVRIWSSSSSESPRLIDFSSTISCATDSIFTINAYRYQGFSLRATQKWDDNSARILTSEGMDKSNGNATRARWCDVNGVSDFGTSGILFMSHPQNHNFPEQLRIWPPGSNQGKENVFINFNPSQEQDWVIQPGKEYTLKYRMLVYDGQLSPELMERYWQDYNNPPKVEIVLNHLNTRKKKVLVYTKNGEGYVHDNIETTVNVLKELGESNDIIVDASDDPSSMTDENLQQYDALIFSNTNNATFDTEDQKLAFQRFIQAGGGFVGIHSTSGSERNWPWFSKTLGGKFRRHPPLQQFDIEVLEPHHPSTVHLRDIWTWEDECYYLERLNPDAKVLLAARLTTVEDEQKAEYPGQTFGNLFPLSWCRVSKLGRVWYTALGHKKEYYHQPVFRKHLLGGILWVLDGSDIKDYSEVTSTLIID